MELPGMIIDEQVLGLLADPPVPTLTGQHNAQLCETVDALVRVQRGVQVALWRELDEMVTRQGTRRAVDITADWLHAHSAFPLADARAMVVLGVRICADPAVLAAFAAGEFVERESKCTPNPRVHRIPIPIPIPVPVLMVCRCRMRSGRRCGTRSWTFC